MSSDVTHFDEYRAQTEVKHIILEKYLPAFLHILKKAHNRLLVVDAFAGRGWYKTDDKDATAKGSPLRVLETICRHPDLKGRTVPIFIEKRQDNFEALLEAVNKWKANNELPNEPVVEKGEFATAILEALADLDKEKQNIAPTFLFVDPCGVDGVDFRAVCGVLKRDGCEVFLFFNFSGVHRILGTLKDDKESSATLECLLGSPERVAELVLRLRASKENGISPEDTIVSYYVDLLRGECGADFVLPFRIEREDRRTTSHYLIHATKNAIGFRIMKDVMFSVGTAGSDGVGSLELRQAGASDISVLFRTDIIDAKKEILALLAKGPALVSSCTIDLAERPNDMLAPKAYKQLLLQLEESGHIKVYDKQNTNLSPSTARRKIKGKPTLADDYWLRLPA